MFQGEGGTWLSLFHSGKHFVESLALMVSEVCPLSEG